MEDGREKLGGKFENRKPKTEGRPKTEKGDRNLEP
jgi:hypothetical protein